MHLNKQEEFLITAVGDTTCSDDAKKTFQNIANEKPDVNLFLGEPLVLATGPPTASSTNSFFKSASLIPRPCSIISSAHLVQNPAENPN
jgi:hypothetical protein